MEYNTKEQRLKAAIDQLTSQKDVRTAYKVREWLASDPVILDTETTGLWYQEEVIEIAIIDSHDKVLINERIKPKEKEKWPEAEAIHGISPADLVDCRMWDEVHNEVMSMLNDRPVLIFNSEYDTRLIAQTARFHGLDVEFDEHTHCAMYAAADVYGSTNRYGSISLANAVLKAGVEWRGKAHTALADCYATLDVLREIAKYADRTDAKIEALKAEYDT